jgi:hypothetical protein
MTWLTASLLSFVYSLLVSLGLAAVSEVAYRLVYHFDIVGYLTPRLRQVRGSGIVTDWEGLFAFGLPPGVSMAFLGFSISVTYLLPGARVPAVPAVILVLVDLFMWALSVYIWNKIVSEKAIIIASALADTGYKVSYKVPTRSRWLYPLGTFAFFLALLWSLS